MEKVKEVVVFGQTGNLPIPAGPNHPLPTIQRPLFKTAWITI